SHRQSGGRPLPMFLWRGRLVRFRSPQVSGTRRLRSGVGTLLSRGHRPGVYGVEARMEGGLPAGERRVPRAPRDNRQEIFSGVHPVGSQEELHPVLLEEHSRMAAAGQSFFLRVGGRRAGRYFRGRTATPQSGGDLAGVPPASTGGPFAP